VVVALVAKYVANSNYDIRSSFLSYFCEKKKRGYDTFLGKGHF